MPLHSPLVEKALRVAARAHRSQTRKGSDLPYLSHPAAVAMILLRAGFGDEEVLAAALLHDAVEDTDYSAGRLAAEFPPRVVEYVLALTERKRDEQDRPRPWEVRKEEHVAHVRHAPAGARAIVLADKLHNLATMCFDVEEAGGAVWSRFNAPRERVLWYNRAMIDAATQGDERLQPLARECEALLARLEALG